MTDTPHDRLKQIGQIKHYMPFKMVIALLVFIGFIAYMHEDLYVRFMAHPSLNALIIGTGGVGSVVGQKLHGYPAFERIFLGDVDTTYAQRLHDRTKKSRFRS